MNNKLVKTLMISFVLVFSMFFINVNDAEAADSCTCYFKGLSAERTEMQGGNNTRNVVKRDVYLLEMKVYKGKHTYNHSDIKYFGEATVENYVDNNYNSTTELKKRLTNKTTDANFLKGHNEANYVRVVEGNCSVSRCKGVTVTFHSWGNSKDIAIGVKASQLDGVNVNLNAISSDEAKTTKTAEHGNEILDTVKDKGKTDNSSSNSSNGNELGSGVEKEELGCQLLDRGVDGKTIIDDLKTIFTIMQIAGILILLLLSIWDFAKAITSSDDDRLKKVSKRFIFRLVAAAILLLLPVIIKLVLDIMKVAGATQIGDFCIDQFL